MNNFDSITTMHISCCRAKEFLLFFLQTHTRRQNAHKSTTGNDDEDEDNDSDNKKMLLLQFTAAFFLFFSFPFGVCAFVCCFHSIFDVYFWKTKKKVFLFILICTKYGGMHQCDITSLIMVFLCVCA